MKRSQATAKRFLGKEPEAVYKEPNDKFGEVANRNWRKELQAKKLESGVNPIPGGAPMVLAVQTANEKSRTILS